MTLSLVQVGVAIHDGVPAVPPVNLKQLNTVIWHSVQVIGEGARAVTGEGGDLISLVWVRLLHILFDVEGADSHPL